MGHEGNSGSNDKESLKARLIALESIQQTAWIRETTSKNDLVAKLGQHELARERTGAVGSHEKPLQ